MALFVAEECLGATEALIRLFMRSRSQRFSQAITERSRPAAQYYSTWAFTPLIRSRSQMARVWLLSVAMSRSG
jgi:hypothetical protein